MIAIITPAEYWFGHPPILRLGSGSDLNSRDRRLTRTPTLDGGAVVYDGGYAEADRTFSLTLMDLSEDDGELLATIAAFPLHRVSLPVGCFEGYVKSYVANGRQESNLSFIVTAKIS